MILSLLRGKYCLIHLELVSTPKIEIITLISYKKKQDNNAPHPHTTLSCLIRFRRTICLLLRLLEFLTDLKSTLFERLYALSVILKHIYT